MLSALVEGTLTARPVSRTTTGGKPYTTAQMRAAGEDGDSVLCSLIAFNADAAAALADLANGDAVAIAGHAAISQWEKDGEHRAGLKITVTRLMTVYEAGQRRKSSTRSSSEAAA